MAISTNTFKTRVQLKSDTETNWNKAGPKDGSVGFIPLLGELIVYTADDAHPFSRLKVGDGNTNVVNLPFIDAGTINGELLPESQVLTYTNREAFPSPGQPNILYVDLTTGTIYCFTNASGYTKLSNFIYTIEKAPVSNITYWNPGIMTNLSCNGGILKADNGTLPVLSRETVQVVKNLTKEASG